VCSVDFEVTCVDIVALHHHLEHFRLMHCALLHKVDYLVLHCDRMVHVVVQLHLKLVFQLPVLLQKLLFLYGISEIFIVFSEQTGFAYVGPVVELVTHRVLGPDAQVLATPEQKELMDLLIEMFPVKHVGDPG